MATFPEILAARKAAADATQDMMQLLDADFALLRATDSALCLMRRMYQSNLMRVQVADLDIVKHADELHCLLLKYGFELVASEKYVDGWDMRVIGTDTLAVEEGYVGKVIHNPSTLMQDIAQVRNECGQQPRQTPQFKPGCI